MALMIAVAGALHLYFYTFSKQGQALKYDKRPLMKNGKQFTLGGQIRDNMFWTLGSGVTIWTAYEVLMFWAMANGYAPVLNWAENPIWFIALFLLIPLWESFYFYWIHRMLHTSHSCINTFTRCITVISMLDHGLDYPCTRLNISFI